MLSIVIPFYNNYEALEKVEPYLSKFDCEVIIVDDCSDKPLKLDWAKVIRLNEDIKWNQPQANNIGIKYASNSYILRMDIDHWIEDIEPFKIEVPEDTFMMFKRIKDRKIIHPNPNTFLFRKTYFLKVGCYNEKFCGNYGHDDTEFKYRAIKKGYKFAVHPELLINTHSMPTKLERDTTINKQLLESLR